MPIKEIVPLKSSTNWAIMNTIKYDMSPAYQARIPDATKANIEDVVRLLTRFTAHRNEFLSGLINRIGLVIARNQSWENPLAPFKKGLLEYGDTVEEIQTGLLLAHTYDPDKDYGAAQIFGSELPDVQANFHSVNRQNYYKITVNEAMLNRAFLSANGLHELISQILESPTTSDNWDEFLLMCSLFPEYERNGGFYTVKVPDVASMTSNQADAQVALRKMRAMAGNLSFMSTRYNAAKMPMAAKPEDLVILATPDFISGVDVNALAAAFNVDYATMPSKMIPILGENFGIDGAQAIMTTKDFFQVYDKLLQTTSQYNPVSLATNYFLHHHQVISCSRFVPAVLFSTKVGEDSINVTYAVTAVSAPVIQALADGSIPTNITRGGQIELAATASVTATPSDSGVAPTGVAWAVSGGTSGGTYITSTGVLHCGGDETATSLTVTARSTYVDPANPRRDQPTATLAVSVVGNAVPPWPEGGAIASITIAGLTVPGVTAGTTTYSLALPTGTTVTVKDVTVGTYNSAEVATTVTKVAGGYTVTIALDPADPGAVVTYTVNVTN